jgi:hypothetical protein
MGPATGAAVIIVEGVLRMDHGEGVQTTGVLLFHALREMMPICLLHEHGTAKDTELWLQANGLTRYVSLKPTSAKTRLTDLARLRSQHPVALIVEPSPEAAAAEIHAGFPVLLHINPRYARPHWRPDYVPRMTAWDDLVAEAETARLPPRTFQEEA